jgi:rfaE bifunctional protein kinase chain/domain
MNPTRTQEILDRYDQLKIAIIGDFCLDRYFEIDPSRSETSIETNLEVYNVTNVRTQAGAAGTILNNLVALGIPEIHAIGFCGEDAEGWSLRKALNSLKGVNTDHFISSNLRHTFTYSKPLICEPNKPPVELNRLDQKNWTPTPEEISDQICDGIENLIPKVDACIIMDQVDIEETGVITSQVLQRLGQIQQKHTEKLIIADSRRGLQAYPNLTYKMNANEMATWKGHQSMSLDQIKEESLRIAEKSGQPVFVSMADQGIMGTEPCGNQAHAPSLPLRGPIDIVGAGDSVTANLCAALAAGATLDESLQLSMRASSCVIHQLGTTGTATRDDLLQLA